MIGLRENLALNGFDGAEHRIEQADAREYLASLPREPQFDIAVVDPPTFSNSKRTDSDWDVQQDAAELLNEVADKLVPGGVLYFSTNSRRFKLDELALTALDVREISRQTVPGRLPEQENPSLLADGPTQRQRFLNWRAPYEPRYRFNRLPLPNRDCCDSQTP